MNSTKYRKRRNYFPCFNSCGYTGGSVVNLARLLVVIARLNRMALLTAFMLLAVPLVSGFMPSVQANPQLPLTLSVTGPHTTTVNKPVDMTLKLSSHGLAVPDSRLRLFIHDGQDRNLNIQTVEIKLQEGAEWVAVPFEIIDGGVMAAIGSAGKGHRDRHGRGGFSMANNTTNFWHLRLGFGLTGVYSLVVSISPDNGATQLAQPQTVTIEVL